MHVELNRKFRELNEDPAALGTDQLPLVASPNSVDWSALLKLPRVVILSEAGAGKTEEIRQATRQLRQAGKPAFFLRLEDIATSFETAFEEGELGQFEQFEQWLDSQEPGWMLLDSIDEARLQSPKDFERALRTLGVKLKTALQRCHVVMTGRTAAWRPFSDMDLCARHLPFTAPLSQPDQASETGGTGGTDDTEGTGGTGGNGGNRTFRKKPNPSRPVGAEVYQLFSLDGLTKQQVRLYAEARNTDEIDKLFDELDRTDGWAFTTRPLDLDELLDFWQRKRRIGSRLDFLQEGIERRLQETNQDRAEQTPLSLDRAREGARRIAAACTLTRQQTIAVPDGPQHAQGRGLRLDIVLADWSPQEQAAMLQRPIFDRAIYGTVRFHHRVVREYLTAEWMAQLLQNHASRTAVEALIFKTQYGLEVISPTTRPVLPWLALLDPRIEQRALRLAPDVLLEDGDPSKLPLSTRQGILRSLCANLAAGGPRLYTDHGAIQRFAAQDLEADILQLLRAHEDEANQVFLLQMVWQGRLQGLRQEVLRIAVAPTAPFYSRVYAVRALAAIATDEDMAAVRASVLQDPAEQDRRLIAELLEQAPSTAQSVAWLAGCAQNLTPAPQYSVDELRSKTKAFIDRSPIETCIVAVESFWRLLAQEPFVRAFECEISSQHAWLLTPAGRAVRQLILARHPAALEEASLRVLAWLPMAQHYDVQARGQQTAELGEMVVAWPELLFALFWHLIEQARAHPRPGQRAITNFWDIRPSTTFAQFAPEHFDRVTAAIEDRALPDDKLVAFSLAWHLYDKAGRPPDQAQRLQAICARQPGELSQRLQDYLNPPPMDPSLQRMFEQNAEFQAQVDRETAQRARDLEASRVYLQEHLEEIRGTNHLGSTAPRGLSWLFSQMHTIGANSSSWGAGDWKSLEPTFGLDIAEAYRDGLRQYWHRHRPQLVSEGASINSIEEPDLLGLGGVGIESEEQPDWCSRLTPDDIDVAFRYAMREFSGFPVWFQSLFDQAPQTVRELLLREIDFELTVSTADNAPHYVLSNIAYLEQWLWDSLGPALIQRLANSDAVHPSTRAKLLAIVQGSNVQDDAIAQLAQAQTRAQTLGNIERNQPDERVGQWYAVWTGVDPDLAIPALQTFLTQLDSVKRRTSVLMHYLVALVGARHEQTSQVRKAYATLAHLKTLYLLAHEHIRLAEDIERAGRGVYSPGLRDNAQDARESLLAALRAQTGKEGFVALGDIARHHPHHAYRPLFEQYARQLAQADSAGEAWSDEKVRQFHKCHESTPTTHRELYDLAVRRLEDLKHTLEQGDSSDAPMLAQVASEKYIRVYIGQWLTTHSGRRYSATQEEEFADAKRADIRFLNSNVDAAVPVELKLANNWTGPQLFERLQVQLCGDYLRDNRSGCGIFLLVYRGGDKHWELPDTRERVDFPGLVAALRAHWSQLAPTLPHVHEISVIGIDLTVRTA